MMSYICTVENLIHILPKGEQQGANITLASKLVKMVHDIRLSSEQRATLVEAIAVVCQTPSATVEATIANLKHD